MKLVFSHIFNKSLSLTISKVLVIFITLISSVQAIENTSNCAMIKIKPFEDEGEKYIVTISVDNNIPVLAYESAHYNKRLHGNYNYELGHGKHNLLLEIWEAGEYNRYFRKNKNAKQGVIFEPINTKYVQVSVEKGNYYEFSLSGNAAKPKIKLINQKTKRCKIKEKALIAGFTMLNDNENVSPPELPEKLQYRLARLMGNIAKLTPNLAFIENVTQLTLNNTFGTVFDSDVSEIKILTVSPYSLADKLGLASGDIIISLGGELKKVSKGSTSAMLVSGYLQSLKLNDLMKMEVLRNGKEIKLSSAFSPLIFPEVSYQIYGDDLSKDELNALTNKKFIIAGELPKSIEFEYQQLISAINSYFQTADYKDGVVSLSSGKTYDKNYGISGNILKFEKNYGFVINSVKPNSLAEDIGIVENDIIMAINNNSISSDNVGFLASQLESLVIDSNYSVKVMRDKKPMMLTASYQPREFPAFNLNIEIISINTVKNNIAEIFRRMNWSSDRSRFNNMNYYARSGRYRSGNPNRQPARYYTGNGNFKNGAPSPLTP